MLQYVVVFLEGVVTFVSPCLLPMLPVYLSYFMGGGTRGMSRTLRSALGFVLGFTLIFVALGALSATLGKTLIAYRTVTNLITGAVVVLTGLHFTGILHIGVFTRTLRPKVEVTGGGFFSSVLLGMVFSVGWTPCVGTFLGSALLLASQQGSAFRGVLMLILYSLGLGVPFLLCAMFLDRLKSAVGFLKRNMNAVSKISGAFLVMVGVLMMTGLLSGVLAALR